MQLRSPFKHKDKQQSKQYTTIEYPHYGEIKEDYDPDVPGMDTKYRQGRQILIHTVDTTPQAAKKYQALDTQQSARRSKQSDYQKFETYRKKTYGNKIKDPDQLTFKPEKVEKSAWGVEKFASPAVVHRA